jgi:hypothetical protein
VANTAAQFGFKETGYLSGGAPDFQLRSYTIASTYTTAIGLGDPVMLTTGGTQTGTIIQATGALATTVPILGIFKGCSLVPTSGGAPTFSPFWPSQGAAVNGTAYVIDAPNATFLVAGLSAVVSSWYIGWNVNFTTGAPTTTGGGYSVATIDATTATTLGTTSSFLPFKILGLYPGVGNGSDPTTNFNWAIVGFNFQVNRSMSHG